MRPHAAAPLLGPVLLLLLGAGARALGLLPQAAPEAAREVAAEVIKPVDETVRSCVMSYAGGLDSVRPNLGDGMRSHPMTGRAVERNIALCPGLGTTGTRSLFHLLHDLLGFRAQHFHKPARANWVQELQDMLRSLDSGTHDAHHDAKRCSVETSRSNLREHNFAAVPKDLDAIMDTPVPELFLDFWLAFPSAKVILQTRPADAWAASRLQSHHRSPAPVQEPCCLKTDNLTQSELSQLYTLHNDLVRCLVPKEQLFEFDFWTDSMRSLKKLGSRISAFLESGVGEDERGRLPAPSRPRANTTWVAKQRGDNLPGDNCTGHNEIMTLEDWGELAAMSARKGCDLDLRSQQYRR